MLLDKWTRSRVKSGCSAMDTRTDDLALRYRQARNLKTRLVDARFVWERDLDVYLLLEMTVPRGGEDVRIVRHVARFCEPDSYWAAESQGPGSLQRRVVELNK